MVSVPGSLNGRNGGVFTGLRYDLGNKDIDNCSDIERNKKYSRYPLQDNCLLVVMLDRYS